MAAKPSANHYRITGHTKALVTAPAVLLCPSCSIRREAPEITWTRRLSFHVQEADWQRIRALERWHAKQIRQKAARSRASGEAWTSSTRWLCSVAIVIFSVLRRCRMCTTSLIGSSRHTSGLRRSRGKSTFGTGSRSCRKRSRVGGLLQKGWNPRLSDRRPKAAIVGNVCSPASKCIYKVGCV